MLRSKLLIFKLGNAKYACSTECVDRIIKYENLTYLPSKQVTLAGLYNYEGNVIQIYNLAKRLNIQSEVNNTHKKIIIVKNKGKLIGFIVDEVLEVFNYFDGASCYITDSKKVQNLDKKFVKDMILINGEIVIYLSISKIVEMELQESEL